MIVRDDKTNADNLIECFKIGGDTWSNLGMAQYYDAIGDKVNRTVWAEKVLDRLNSPAELRWEPHARLLPNSAALRCLTWLDQRDQSDMKAVYRGVMDDFGLVRAPLAISSPLTKRQESRAGALAQMQFIMNNRVEWAAVGGAATRLRHELTS